MATPSTFPAIVVAYGAHGAAWVHDVLMLCQLDPRFEDLFDHGLVQFWAIGVEQAELNTDRIRAVADASSAVELCDLVDRGRKANLRYDFPGLDVNQVLMLERWSPVTSDVSQRIAFVEAMDLASRANCQAGEPNVFDYNWVGLVDGVRQAGPLTASQHQNVKQHFGLRELRAAQLYVDRVDNDGGVVDVVRASQVLGEIAVTLLQANQAGDRLMSEVVEQFTNHHARPHETLIPLGKTTFRHGPREYATAAGKWLRRIVTQGALQYSHTGPHLELADLCQGHISRLRQGSVSPAELAGQRRQAGEAFLARHVFDRVSGSTDGEQELSRLQDTLSREAYAGTNVAGPGPSSEQNSLWRKWWNALVNMWGGTQSAQGSEELSTHEQQVSSDGLTRAREDWSTFADQLSGCLRAWRRFLWESVPTNDADDPAWTLVDDCLVLTAVPGANRGTPDGQQIVETLVRVSLDVAGECDESDIVDRTLWDAALERVYENDFGNVHDLVVQAFESLRGRFTGFGFRPALSVFTGPRVEPQQVFWFLGSESLGKDLVAELEGRQANILIVSTGDESSTVRLALGAPVPWQDVVSLTPSQEQ